MKLKENKLLTLFLAFFLRKRFDFDNFLNWIMLSWTLFHNINWQKKNFNMFSIKIRQGQNFSIFVKNVLCLKLKGTARNWKTLKLSNVWSFYSTLFIDYKHLPKMCAEIYRNFEKTNVFLAWHELGQAFCAQLNSAKIFPKFYWIPPQKTPTPVPIITTAVGVWQKIWWGWLWLHWGSWKGWSFKLSNHYLRLTNFFQKDFNKIFF